MKIAYGIFHWTPTNFYPKAQAVATRTTERQAQRLAERMNKSTPHNYVVRSYAITESIAQ